MIIKKRKPKENERVKVRLNLNKNMVIVKGATGEDYNKTLCFSESPVSLSDVEFRVVDGAYEKVHETGNRDVCAYMIGKYTTERSCENGTPLFYNPFRQKYFHQENGEPIHSASLITIWMENKKYKLRYE